MKNFLELLVWCLAGYQTWALYMLGEYSTTNIIYRQCKLPIFADFSVYVPRVCQWLWRSDNSLDPVYSWLQAFQQECWEPNFVKSSEGSYLLSHLSSSQMS